MDLSDYLQRWQIGNLRRDTAEAHRSVDRTGTTVRDLEAAVERLTLASMAMWKLLGERAALTDADLLAAIQEIDISDGRLDGRLRQRSRQCPACGRPNHPRRHLCLYCSGPLQPAPL
jgi:hypothetical protein